MQLSKRAVLHLRSREQQMYRRSWLMNLSKVMRRGAGGWCAGVPARHPPPVQPQQTDLVDLGQKPGTSSGEEEKWDMVLSCASTQGPM